jgi:hypothetical protein
LGWARSASGNTEEGVSWIKDGIEETLAAAKRTEEEAGLENLGPWDDFEWA